MVKKINNPLHIDYEKCIIESCLLQIKKNVDKDVPELIRCWSLEIIKRDSKQIIDFIRNNIQEYDPVSFQHLKRIKKTDDGLNLEVVICSLEFTDDSKILIDLLNKNSIRYKNLNSKRKVPFIGPYNKTLVKEWSKLYWPLTWNGNPNDQILNGYKFDIPIIYKTLMCISEQCRSDQIDGNKFPIVSAFIDPINAENIIISTDGRCEKNKSPLDHSIMQGIKKVAALQQRQKQQNCNEVEGSSYLCLNYDVYTTHEPCSMCSMALVHSRIKRLIFMESMPVTGALKPESGDAYCIHEKKTLNSKYEVFQWVGKPFDLPVLDKNTCC